jgi:hypothetical protein
VTIESALFAELRFKSHFSLFSTAGRTRIKTATTRLGAAERADMIVFLSSSGTDVPAKFEVSRQFREGKVAKSSVAL